MRRGLYVSMVVAMTIVGGACGSDDTGDAGATTTEAAESTTTEAPSAPTAEEYSAAFVTSLTTGDPATGVLVLPQEQAECIAPKFVDIITVKALQDNEVTLEDAADPESDSTTSLGLDEGQGNAMAAAFAPCGADLRKLVASYLADNMTAEQIQCAADHLDAAKTEALIGKSFVSDPTDAELEALVTPAVLNCDLPIE